MSKAQATGKEASAQAADAGGKAGEQAGTQAREAGGQGQNSLPRQCALTRSDR